MGEFATSIVQAGRVPMFLAEQMLKDVKPEIFARKPSFGGQVINANHAAFNFGHLALYPSKWLSLVGLDPAPVAPPAGFEDLFAAGKECRDDPEGTIYPSMQVITDAFFRTHKIALETLSTLDDAVLSKPNPIENRLQQALPTVGALLTFYITVHPMLHLGQVSTWRRCFGLGSVL